jgi:hypothetical protein
MNMELRSASRRLVLLVPRWPSPSWRSFIRSPAAHHHSPPLQPLGQQVDGQGDEPCQGNLYDMEPHEPSPLLLRFLPRCWAIGVFAVFFSTYEAAAGIATGYALRNAQGLPAGAQKAVPACQQRPASLGRQHEAAVAGLAPMLA